MTRSALAQLANYHRVFEHIDADQSGTLDAKELHKALTDIGRRQVTAKDAKKMLAEADADGNGTVFDCAHSEVSVEELGGAVSR